MRTTQTDMQSRRLTTQDAAEYLGLAAATLEKFRLTGGGPPFIKLTPRRIVYDTADLDFWMSARRHVSPPR